MPPSRSSTISTTRRAGRPTRTSRSFRPHRARGRCDGHRPHPPPRALPARRLDERPLAGGQLRFGNALDRFEALVEGARGHVTALAPDARIGVAPHSLRAVGEDDIRALAALLPDAPIHLHIAEQEAEVEAVLAATGQRPVDWLLDRFGVDARWCLIHATQMTPIETRRLARSGAIAGLCPVTEANLGDGIFPGGDFVAAGGRFGVGTDSNVCISLADELRQLEYSQRLGQKARAVLAEPGGSVGRFVYEQAAAAGARALGRDAGRIETGAFADLVSFMPLADCDLPRRDALLDAWIFAPKTVVVDDVWSAGRHVVSNGRHRRRAELAPLFQTTLRGVLSRL